MIAFPLFSDILPKIMLYPIFKVSTIKKSTFRLMTDGHILRVTLNFIVSLTNIYFLKNLIRFLGQGLKSLF